MGKSAGAVCGGAALLIALWVASACAGAGDAATSVKTGGSGELTLCRSWLLFRTCQSYNHVALPDRLSVGDTIALVFGSNTKEMTFPVAQIARDAGHCTVFGDTDLHAASDQVDKIDFSPCSEVPGPR
jgi:hypothetical protein